MILILAVDENFSIGYKGDMLFHLKQDLSRFKKITSGNIMVMGRKTLESLPSSKPLPNRTHIVLTKDKHYKNHDAICLDNPDKLDDIIKSLDPNKEKDVFLIGGGNLVKQMLDKCDKAYITYVKKAFDNYDTNIPNLDKLDQWILTEESELQKENYRGEDLLFTYRTYIKNK